MAQSAATQITCPNCQQPFRAILEQLLNVDSDPSVKERLLSGRLNLVTCPHCGFQGSMATPLMYHDNEKQLAITYVPVELGLQKVEEEQIIGSMSRYLVQSLPEEAPKGYLLNPKQVLTLQGMIDLILEADGITPEMIEEQRRKVELVEEMANTPSEDLDALIEANTDMFDAIFFEILSAAAQAASQGGDSQRSLRLLNARSRLLEVTEVGQMIKAQQEAFSEAAEELRALGETISREQFLQVLINAADNSIKIAALATMGRSLIDYTLFQMITDRIKVTDDPAEKERLTGLREELLEINAAFEQQARAVLAQAVETLKAFLTAPDVGAAVRANASRLDDAFLQVLQANLEEARRSGQLDAYSKLREVRDEVLKLLQEASPPELRLINDLMSIENDDEALEALRGRADEINERVIELMDEIVGHFQEAGNEVAVQRMTALRDEAIALTNS
jgi:hypothetical protein